MKNNKFIFISLLIVTTILLLKNEESFQDKFALYTLPIKEAYLNLTNSIEISTQKYLSQADSIEEIKEENVLLRKYLYQQKKKIIQLQELYQYNDDELNLLKNVLRVQTISYKKLNDFSQIYLTRDDELIADNIYGLIQKNVAAGIAIKEKGLLKGILISNPECQFSTFIGKNKIPGIAKGIDEKSMEVNFIPKWSKITIGDNVVTSGLDNIFLSDIPVGTITKIITKSSYKTAIIKTYADILHPNYFYLVKEVLHEPMDINMSRIKLDNNVTH